MGVQACRLPCFILQPTGTPRPHINVFLWASKPAVCQPLNPLKPLKTLKRLKTLTTCHGGPNLPFAMLHPAASRHPKATHQWLLLGVRRLPCFILQPTGTPRPHINGFLWNTYIVDKYSGWPASEWHSITLGPQCIHAICSAHPQWIQFERAEEFLHVVQTSYYRRHLL